ncbi:HAMP domain-containing protein [Crenobacter cavernae]|uniref:histidine kinase n=2 Tax=Crenobacter cavernae TaxID=2290923 RepID=A0ABY0FBS5_9NEIS|nr:HAMP domain-containing protein [Crenobacter cavernae]
MAGLIAANLAGLWLNLDERVRMGRMMRSEFAAQRIAEITSLLNDVAPNDRKRLVRVLDAPPIRLSTSEPWQAPGKVAGDDAAAFAAKLSEKLGDATPLQVLSIRSVPRGERRHRPPTPDGARLAEPPPRSGTEARAGPRGAPLTRVLAQTRLADGTVLTFRYFLPGPNPEAPLRLLGWLALIAASVTLLSAWAVRRLTRPLAVFSDAATGLAKNLDQPPLPETGPHEVAQAARAFNAMQTELKRYLDTRAEMLAGISHDLRLPITRVRLRLEALPDGAHKAGIDKDLAEMDALIDDTLAFLRAGNSGEPAARVNLNALIDGVLEDAEALGATVERHGQASAPVTARPLALRRCLANLVDNARRYGGPAIDVSVTEEGGTLDILVEDRGPGLPDADRERVFEPYVRLEASRARHTGGSGLGLAIARAIARGHGGDIRLEARPGGGLCARLTLPTAS